MRRWVYAFVFGCVCATVCLTRHAPAADRVPVFVSIAPQKYFVQQIGKDLVDVQIMVQPAASPHTYEPKPRQMADLSKTKIYFAHTYGLEQVPIEIEGKEPKPAQLTALIQQAREKGIRVVFAQPQFSAKSAALVAREIGGQVALADPLAEDWMANLRAVADKFKAALQ